MRRLAHICLLAGLCGGLRAEIIPPERVIPWQAGVLGGIPTITTGPSVTDYGAVADGVTDCFSAVTNALGHCPAGQAVYFPAGTYFLATNVLVGRYTPFTRAVFRGAGIGKTIIICGMSNTYVGAFYFAGGAYAGSNALASGYVRGANVLEAASVTGLANGQQVEVGQTNDLTFVVGNTPASVRYQGQINQITNLSGNTISLLRPLYTTYDAAYSPWIRTWASYVTNSGVEDMTLKISGMVISGVYFSRAQDCWVKGVEVTNYIMHTQGDVGISLNESSRCEVRRCLTHCYTTSGSRYGIQLANWSTDCLVEDNITGQNNIGVIVQNGSSGNVVAYNYNYAAWTATSLGWSICAHGGAPSWNLVEGNMGNGTMGADNTWGGNPYNTWVRNWSTAFTAGSTTSRDGFYFADTNYFNSAVGNLLCRPADFGAVGNNPYPWYWGVDATTLSTTLRHGNFEFRTNTLAWDGTIADHVIPASYYLASKPSWFSNLVWPAIGPDVNTNSAITNLPVIPAQARWLGVNYGPKVTGGTWTVIDLHIGP